MINEYRRATEEEAKNYPVGYDLLVGPNNFECLLTEPEDRIWYRDLKPVIIKLNELHSENEKLKELVRDMKIL